MSQNNCPYCQEIVPASALNIEQSVVFCPACEHLFRLQELQFWSRPVEEMLASPPRGCKLKKTRQEQGEVLTLVASRSSFSGVFGSLLGIGFLGVLGVVVHLILFTEQWDEGFERVDVENTEGTLLELKEQFWAWEQVDLVIFLALLVYGVFWVQMVWELLIYLGGSLNLQISLKEGQIDPTKPVKIKEGLGILSWGKNFYPSNFEKMRTPREGGSAEQREHLGLLLEGKRKLRFGEKLSTKRQEWLQLTLGIMLFSTKDSSVRRELLRKA